MAVDKAGELARALGAPVHVVCVPGALEANEWPARISAQKVVAETADRLRTRGVSVEMHIPKDGGDPALALVAVAAHGQAQMIVLGNKGLTGVRRILGSLPKTVSRQAGCDVLIVPTQSGPLAELTGGSVVVGLNGDGGATRVTSEAIRLSKALGGDLHVVATATSGDRPRSVAEAIASEATGAGVNAVAHTREEDPADALLQVADATNAGVVVVGSTAADGPAVADKLVSKASVSVLIVVNSGELDSAAR